MRGMALCALANALLDGARPSYLTAGSADVSFRLAIVVPKSIVVERIGVDDGNEQPAH